MPTGVMMWPANLTKDATAAAVDAVDAVRYAVSFRGVITGARLTAVFGLLVVIVCAGALIMETRDAQRPQRAKKSFRGLQEALAAHQATVPVTPVREAPLESTVDSRPEPVLASAGVQTAEPAGEAGLEPFAPTEPSGLAWEMARVQLDGKAPAEKLALQMEVLLREAKLKYPDATEFEIRDATYKIATMQAYGRPDLTIAGSLQALVESEILAYTEPTPQQVADRFCLDAVIAYNQWVQQQQAGYYERRAQMDETIRNNRIRAKEEAQARTMARDERARAAAAATLEQQRIFSENSLFGQLMPR